jgi:RNA polymerase sigma factor (sigma-70 family)
MLVAERPRLLSIAALYAGSATLAEEILQEGILRVVLASPELETSDHLRAYLLKTIQNLAIDARRRDARRPALVVLDDLSPSDELHLSHNDDLSQVLVSAEESAIVREAISLLSHAERAVLIRSEIEGKGNREIADELGIKESKVKSTLSRARSSLRKILSLRVIDEKSGLTGLDYLAESRRRMSQQGSRKSKIVVTAVLAVGIFSMNHLFIDPQSNYEFTAANKHTSALEEARGQSAKDFVVKESSPTLKSHQPKAAKAKAALPQAALKMPAFEEEAIFDIEKSLLPFSMILPDRSEYPLAQSNVEKIVSESGYMVRNVLSSRGVGANLVISQTFSTDAFGTDCDISIIASHEGYWRVLDSRVLRQETKRTASGNYRVDVVLSVAGWVESELRLPANLGLNPLPLPRWVHVQVVLDGSRTEILAQRISFSGSSQDDEA